MSRSGSAERAGGLKRHPGKPIFLVYMLESGQVEGMPGEITPEILQGMEAQGISLDQVMDELDQKLGEMEGSILTQSDILYVQQEYEALGVDVGAIQIQYIVITGLKMLGLALAAMLATIIVTLLASRTAAGVAKNLRNDVFQKVVSFSNQEFEKFSTASLITRSTNDIQQIQMLLVLLLRIVFTLPSWRWADASWPCKRIAPCSGSSAWRW